VRLRLLGAAEADEPENVRLDNHINQVVGGTKRAV